MKKYIILSLFAFMPLSLFAQDIEYPEGEAPTQKSQNTEILDYYCDGMESLGSSSFDCHKSSREGTQTINPLDTAIKGFYYSDTNTYHMIYIIEKPILDKTNTEGEHVDLPKYSILAWTPERLNAEIYGALPLGDDLELNYIVIKDEEIGDGTYMSFQE